MGSALPKCMRCFEEIPSFFAGLFIAFKWMCICVCVCMWWHGLLCFINTHWPVCAMKVSSSWTNQERWTELAGQLEIIYCGSAVFLVTSLSSSQMDQELKNSLFEIFYYFLLFYAGFVRPKDLRKIFPLNCTQMLGLPWTVIYAIFREDILSN